MVALPETFSPNDVPEDDRNFEPIPQGRYKLQIIDSTIADTKSGNGEMITLTLEVLEGQYKGRKIWDRLNYRHLNPDAQRIAQQSLKALCDLLGIAHLRDTEELHFKPFEARVLIQADKTGQYPPQNSVRYGQQGGPPVGKPGGRPAQPTRADSTKPWAKNDVPF